MQYPNQTDAGGDAGAATSSVMLRVLTRDPDARTQVLAALYLSEQARLVSSCRTWAEWMTNLASRSTAVLRANRPLVYTSTALCLTMATSKWARAVVTDVEPAWPIFRSALVYYDPNDVSSDEARAKQARRADEAYRFWATLTQLPYLRRLRIHGVEAMDAPSESLASLCRDGHRLEELDIGLSGTYGEQMSVLAHLLRHVGLAPALRSLVLTVTEDSNSNPEQVLIAYLQGQTFEVLPTLLHLDTFCFRVPTRKYMPSVAQVHALAQCALLEELDCGTWRIDFETRSAHQQLAEGLAILVKGPAGRSLRRLALNRTLIDSGVWSLLQRMPQLINLTGQEWRISAEEWLVGLSVFTGVEEMYLTRLPAGVHLPTLFAAQAHSLKKLTFWCAELTEATGFRKLLTNLVQLTDLSLHFCTFDSLADFSAALPHLTRMRLSSCQLRLTSGNTDSALRPLETLPKMPYLTQLTIVEPYREGLHRNNCDDPVEEAYRWLYPRLPRVARQHFRYESSG